MNLPESSVSKISSALAKVTRTDPAKMRATLDSVIAEVTENNAKLNACVAPHNFISIEPDKILNGKFRCSKCGGTIRGHDLYWYNKGLLHGKIL